MSIESLMTKWQETDPFSYEGSRIKAAFHREGKNFLKEVAKAMGLPANSYEIKNDKGGVAVLGDVYITGDTIWVEVCDALWTQGMAGIWRDCKGRGRYGGNNWFRKSELASPATLAAFIRERKRA